MKKKYKNKFNFFLGFILGGIIFSPIVLFAANTINSGSILFSSSNTSVNNLSDAIDELYGKASYGNADSSQILNGKTVLVNGKKVTGSMVDNTGSTGVTLTSTDTRPVSVVAMQSGDSRIWYLNNSDGSKRLNIGIPGDGFYSYANILGVKESDLASILGITANKIASGNTIAGVTGTYTGGGGLIATGTFTTSSPTEQTITCGFRPKYIVVSSTWPLVGSGNAFYNSETEYYDVTNSKYFEYYYTASSASPAGVANTAGGTILTARFSVTSTGFTHKARYANKTAIYICVG